MKMQIHDNILALQQGARLLQSIDDGVYQHRVDRVFKGTIGAHVRHNLDHYRLFMTGLESGHIDYEARQRNTAIEFDREAALTGIVNICKQLHALSDHQGPLRLRVRSNHGNECAWAQTSASRELDFLLSHTTHHYALVAVMCRLGDVPIEEGFGLAPSTLRYLDSLDNPCAR